VTELPILSTTNEEVVGADDAFSFPLTGGRIGRMTLSDEMTTFDVGASLNGGNGCGPGWRDLVHRQVPDWPAHTPNAA
jgi:hypothetical protein